MVATKRLLSALVRSNSSRAVSSTCSCVFLSLISRKTATTSWSVFSCPVVTHSNGLHRISTQTNWPGRPATTFRYTKFKRANVIQTRRISKCRQKGRPISHVHPFKKFVADKFGDGNAEQRFGRRRSEND